MSSFLISITDKMPMCTKMSFSLYLFATDQEKGKKLQATILSAGNYILIGMKIHVLTREKFEALSHLPNSQEPQYHTLVVLKIMDWWKLIPITCSSSFVFILHFENIIQEHPRHDITSHVDLEPSSFYVGQKY